MSSLITGATGFIGRHLMTRLIAQQEEVLIVLRRGHRAPEELRDAARTGFVSFIEYSEYDDLRAAVGEAKPDVVYHLATHYTKTHKPTEIELLADANVALGMHLLGSIGDLDTRFVSTLSYFQFTSGEPSPFSLYSATKQAFSEVCRFYREIAGVAVREVVLYDTYGPHDTRAKLLPLLLRASRDRTAVRLGAPDQRINYLHVDDVASGLIAASVDDSASRFQLRADEDISVQRLVELVGTLSGTPLNCSFDPAAVADDRMITSGTWPTPSGWQPRISLEQGLAELV